MCSRKGKVNAVPLLEAPPEPLNLKLKQLMDDLMKNSAMGKVKGYLCVIEFQKRGLPHAHILATLEDEDMPRTAADKFVCAEIPDQQRHPLVFETVESRGMHGSCGKSIPPDLACNTAPVKTGQSWLAFKILNPANKPLN
jgi:hypothetical protein